jgi:DNA-binding MarR family transcriptional regulator
MGVTMNANSRNDDDSISGQSAAYFISKDDSLASLLLNHGIKVRDFIVLSFLSDQGPMSILRLVRVVGIEPEKMLRSLRRLSAANLVLREPATTNDELQTVARLTGRGEEIAGRINAQLE